MNRKIFLLILVCPLLLAVRCEDDDYFLGNYLSNNFKVTVDAQNNLRVGDTIWVKANVSAYVFEEVTNDSVFVDFGFSDNFFVSEFVVPIGDYNVVDAVNRFEVIPKTGITYAPLNCENSAILVDAEIDFNNTKYTYEIGLRLLTEGDFILSWSRSDLTNEQRNLELLNDYPLDVSFFQVGFLQCERISWRNVVDISRDYLLRVEAP